VTDRLCLKEPFCRFGHEPDDGRYCHDCPLEERRRKVGEEQYLDAKAVSELLGLKESWVRARTREGEIPHYPFGRYRRYVRAEVLEWAKGLRQGGA
jgi:excisionase family DNA binding protein